MPVFPRTTYESLDDKEIVLSGDIFSVIEISRYQKAIEEILLLPQDMITLGKHPSLREKRDITEELSKQLLISGTIEDKRGYRHVNTGKFAGEEHLPGRNPRFDAKLDWLERNGKYMAANGNKVHFRGAYDSQWTSHNCGALLAEILGFKPHLGDDRDQFEKDQEFLGKQMVLDGLAEHHMMPSGFWHAGTGLCLGGNTGGMRGDLYYNFLHEFRIINRKQR